MRRVFFVILLAVTTSFFTFAFEKNDVKIFTLENGLTLYFLHDSTTATVRMELNIKAGISYQSPDNAGFFALYARLLGLEITPDCVRTETTVAPAQSEKAFISLVKYLKPISISDKELAFAVKELRQSINDFALSPAGFINCAIDTRVFPLAPWAQESGVNPSAFNSKTTEEIRTILASIGQSFYRPENSILYVSGNITSSSALMLAEKYLGSIKSYNEAKTNSAPTYSEQNDKKSSKPIKYVITDDELSKDLTQIVIQYTNLSEDEANLTAQIFNNPNSQFKQLLLKQRNLSIRGADYIDASSAQQNNSSRLIIQAICEKTKVSPATQGDLFLMMSKDNEKPRITSQEFSYAMQKLRSDFTSTSDSSTHLMKELAQFNRTNKESGRIFFNQLDSISFSAESLNQKYIDCTPIVFVLCNTGIYRQYASEFKKLGYAVVTAKNGPWYNLERYKKLLANSKKESDTSTKDGENDIKNSATRFIESNRSQFSSFTLKNSIPVTIKKIDGAKTVSIALAIEGGELIFAEKNAGLSELLTNALATNIRSSIDYKIADGTINSNANVTAKTDAESALLTITCDTSSCYECMKAISDAVIFGDITPAMADGISYDLRTQWRIKTGAPDFQLLCAAAKSLFSKPVSNLYNDLKDRPEKMEFTSIAESYPIILDSSRFSIIIAGGITQNDELTTVLNSTFGELISLKKTESIKTKIEKKSLPKKNMRVSLRHQFFTDVSADKAGPRPAVLIPTTDFSDPLLYIIEGPDLNSTDSALFNALLYELCERLQKLSEKEQKVKVTVPNKNFPYAQITVTKIKHTAKTDSLYSNAVQSLATELEGLIAKNTDGVIDTEKDALLEELENKWLIEQLSKTSDSYGTAELIHQGLSLLKPDFYLDLYQAVSTASAEDYYLILKSFIESTPTLRVYSADSKR